MLVNKQSIKNFPVNLKVKFIEWFPYYQEIRQEFQYSTEKDQEAADSLSKMIRKKALNIRILQKKIAGRRVLVIGAGPGLQSNIKFIKRDRKSIKIAADDTVQVLIENKIRPNIVVTDLDGNASFLQKAEKLGAIIVVHAHADNMDILKKIIPKFKRVIGSTQVMPTDNVYNFGGFTDGDRSVFLAEEFGAKEIILVGMELGDRVGNYSKTPIENFELKKKKLRVGKRLLEVLAKRSRSELFDTSKKPIKGFTSLYNL
jgi:2-amino-4-hydroxy-6-hydroxymethyldihydropteridine diphosphokinase